MELSSQLCFFVRPHPRSDHQLRLYPFRLHYYASQLACLQSLPPLLISPVNLNSGSRQQAPALQCLVPLLCHQSYQVSFGAFQQAGSRQGLLPSWLASVLPLSDRQSCPTSVETETELCSAGGMMERVEMPLACEEQRPSHRRHPQSYSHHPPEWPYLSRYVQSLLRHELALRADRQGVHGEMYA